jgi:hypothetical protein
VGGECSVLDWQAAVTQLKSPWRAEALPPSSEQVMRWVGVQRDDAYMIRLLLPMQVGEIIIECAPLARSCRGVIEPWCCDCSMCNALSCRNCLAALSCRITLTFCTARDVLSQTL